MKPIKKPQPTRISPMLATLTDEYFSDPEWIFEDKLDGERCIAFVRNGTVRLRSRNHKVLDASYPEIVEALEKHNTRQFVADGEIVAFDGKRTSFAKLQKRIGLTDPDRAVKTGVKVFYYIFDLLWLDGYDICPLPLAERRQTLKTALRFSGPIRVLPYREREGEKFLHEACKKNLEGIIAKRKESVYKAGRSRDWLKFKCSKNQEFVVGGFTEPSGSRIGFGALLVGYYEKGKLRYAGKVGTGYSNEVLKNLSDKLKLIEKKESPFRDSVREKRVRWVKPRLVADVAFSEWTRDGKLRHPRFVGLRRDKKPRDVRREEAS